MSELIFLSLDEVHAIHARSLAEHGGSAGIRDSGLIESALASARNTFHYASGDVFDVAASYAFHLAESQAFIDGNKRTGVVAAMVFLGILMPVVISALITANRASVVAERSTLAAQLGENKLGELMLGNAWSSASPRGDFGAEWSGYRWELSKPAWQTGAMTELTLDVFYKVQGIEHDARLSTLVDASLTSGTTTTP